MSWSSSAELEPKQAQLMATLQWVEGNYEWSEGVCVPRCLLYQHYLDFCSGTGFVSVGPATFGKIIRQRFPKLTTRRLGTRGQSRYHYYGIGIKVTSPYHTLTHTGSGLSKFSRATVKTQCWSSAGAPSDTGPPHSLLPLFPQLSDLHLPNPSLDPDNLQTFLVMYRKHCGRIVDAVVTAAFLDVEKLLLHFWASLPPRLGPLLQHPSLALLLAICDHNLYQVLSDLLLPSSFRDMPDSLQREMTSFASQLGRWVGVALASSPAPLLQAKLRVCGWFVTSLKRHLSFIRLARICSEVVVLGESSRAMARDLSSLPIATICQQLTCVCGPPQPQLILKHFDSLVALLTKQAPLEDYVEWTDHVLRVHLIQNYSGSVPVARFGRRFLLAWTYLLSLVTRQLTLRTAPSFGALHVLEVCVSEYVHLVVESERISELAHGERVSALASCVKSGSDFHRWLTDLDHAYCSSHLGEALPVAEGEGTGSGPSEPEEEEGEGPGVGVVNAFQLPNQLDAFPPQDYFAGAHAQMDDFLSHDFII